MKTNIKADNARAISHLDVYDLSHDQETQDNESERRTRHPSTHLFFNKKHHVGSIDEVHHHGDDDRNAGQNSTRHTTMGGDRSNLASQLEALTDQPSELFKNLSEIAAGTFLQDDRCDKKPYVEHRHASR